MLRIYIISNVVSSALFNKNTRIICCLYDKTLVDNLIRFVFGNEMDDIDVSWLEFYVSFIEFI